MFDHLILKEESPYTQANMLALERPLAPSANQDKQMMTSMRPHHVQNVRLAHMLDVGSRHVWNAPLDR